MNTLAGLVLSRPPVAALVVVAAVLFVVRVVPLVRRAAGAAVAPSGELPAARPETPVGVGADAGPALAPAGVGQRRPEGRAA